MCVFSYASRVFCKVMNMEWERKGGIRLYEYFAQIGKKKYHGISWITLMEPL